MLLWPLAKLSQTVMIQFQDIPDPMVRSLRHLLVKEAAWPVDTLSMASQLVDQLHSKAKDDWNSWYERLRKQLKHRDYVDASFDLNLTAMVNEIRRCHR